MNIKDETCIAKKIETGDPYHALELSIYAIQSIYGAVEIKRASRILSLDIEFEFIADGKIVSAKAFFEYRKEKIGGDIVPGYTLKIWDDRLKGNYPVYKPTNPGHRCIVKNFDAPKECETDKWINDIEIDEGQRGMK